MVVLRELFELSLLALPVYWYSNLSLMFGYSGVLTITRVFLFLTCSVFKHTSPPINGTRYLPCATRPTSHVPRHTSHATRRFQVLFVLYPSVPWLGFSIGAAFVVVSTTFLAFVEWFNTFEVSRTLLASALASVATLALWGALMLVLVADAGMLLMFQSMFSLYSVYVQC